MVRQVHAGFLDHFLPVQNLFLNLLMKYYTHKMTKKKRRKKTNYLDNPFPLPPIADWMYRWEILILPDSTSAFDPQYIWVSHGLDEPDLQ